MFATYALVLSGNSTPIPLSQVCAVKQSAQRQQLLRVPDMIFAGARVEAERVERRNRLRDRAERRVGGKHHSVGAEEISPQVSPLPAPNSAVSA